MRPARLRAAARRLRGAPQWLRDRPSPDRISCPSSPPYIPHARARLADSLRVRLLHPHRGGAPGKPEAQAVTEPEIGSVTDHCAVVGSGDTIATLEHRQRTEGL